MSTNKENFANYSISNYIYENGVTVPVKVHFVDNINDSWLLYTNDSKVIDDYIVKDFTDLNGLAMPFDGATYHILIRNDYVDYECTIIHECTHVIDYDKFRLLFNSGNIDIYYHPFYYSMVLYSEFHARAVAHRYYYDKKVEDSNKKQAEFKELGCIITNIQELEQQIYNKNKNNLRDLLNDLMQFLGRICSFNFKCLPPCLFDNKTIKLYNCLVALDSQWNEKHFQAMNIVLKEIYE